jgi:hypothetical protein
MEKKDEKGKDLREEARIGGKLPGRNLTEQTDIEQTRIENRRDADLDDKTPGGDGGPEDREGGVERGENNY